MKWLTKNIFDKVLFLIEITLITATKNSNMKNNNNNDSNNNKNNNNKNKHVTAKPDKKVVFSMEIYFGPSNFEAALVTWLEKFIVMKKFLTKIVFFP